MEQENGHQNNENDHMQIEGDSPHGHSGKDEVVSEDNNNNSNSQNSEYPRFTPTKDYGIPGKDPFVQEPWKQSFFGLSFGSDKN